MLHEPVCAGQQRIVHGHCKNRDSDGQEIHPASLQAHPLCSAGTLCHGHLQQYCIFTMKENLDGCRKSISGSDAHICELQRALMEVSSMVACEARIMHTCSCRCRGACIWEACFAVWEAGCECSRTEEVPGR